MKILSTKQIHQADAITIINQNISSLDLMERAATVLTRKLISEYDSPERLLIFCGVGNNGGDGLVVGRLLIEQGWNVQVFMVEFSQHYSPDCRTNLQHFQEIAAEKLQFIRSESDFPKIEVNDWILDGIFGIGLNRSPEGWLKKLILHLNQNASKIIAIDTPSGLFSEQPTSDFDAVIQADIVYTFQFPKFAFFLPNNADFVKEFHVLDIGLDRDFITKAKPLAQVIGSEEAATFRQPRARFGHKGSYGHTVIIGGSYGKIGATVLASRAAFRSGAGLVSVFTPTCGYAILQTAVPEAMVVNDKNQDIITEIALPFEPNSVAIGMGMGTNPETAKALGRWLTTQVKPIVIDADALNIISENPYFLDKVPQNSILTPHPGELKRLLGPWKNDYEKIEKAKRFVANHKVILLIKGAYSMLVAEDTLYINSTGNPGMATAGSGDALSGILAGLLSQGYPPIRAALFGVYLHGLAGDLAAEKYGMDSLVAGDIIDAIPNAYRALEKKNGAD